MKAKQVLIVVSLIAIVAVSIYVGTVYFPLEPSASSQQATITLAPPSPDEVTLFSTQPTTITFSGVAYHGASPSVKIRIVMNGYNGIAGQRNEHYFDFIAASGYFSYDIVVPDDFNPSWYGTYDNYAQLLGDNNTVLATSAVFSIKYSPVE